MRTKSRALAVKVAGHAAMGAGIGGGLALWTLLRQLDLCRLIPDGAAPEATALVVAAAVTAIFAVGAGISGFLFMLLEDEV